MRCAEIRTRDTLLIPSEAAKLKKLLEINVYIYSKKYKYVSTPSGLKLLIEGIKAYTVSYIKDSKKEKVITKTIKIPFCTFMPVSSNSGGYRSIEFTIGKLDVTDVSSLRIITDLVFKVICYENYNEKDSGSLSPEVMDIRPSESTLKFKEEKAVPFSDTYRNRTQERSGFEILNYINYQNINVFSLILFLLVICVYFNHNRLR
ncbi:MAG: hypothetical protein AB6733_03490 [Clostridiaceae bacterium]